MKTLASMLLACLLIPAARADDGTLMAVAGQVLIGTEAGRGWTFVEVAPGQYDVRGETHGVTYEQILAATNRADVLAAYPHPYPTPDSVVPVLDAQGNQTGTARLLVDAAGALVIVTDSASPQRSVAVQLAEFKARAADAKAEREAYKALLKAIAADKKLDKATADAAKAADEKAAKKDAKK